MSSCSSVPVPSLAFGAPIPRRVSSTRRGGIGANPGGRNDVACDLITGGSRRALGPSVSSQPTAVRVYSADPETNRQA
jgi:hypothetical protein